MPAVLLLALGKRTGGWGCLCWTARVSVGVNQAIMSPRAHGYECLGSTAAPAVLLFSPSPLYEVY